MADAALPAEVRLLVARHLSSMEQVEALLFLARSSPRALESRAIGAALRLAGDALAPATLAALERAALVESDGSTPPRFRYAPRSAELRRAVDALAAAYHSRPVSLIRLLYERPNVAQTFPDAFPSQAEER